MATLSGCGILPCLVLLGCCGFTLSLASSNAYIVYMGGRGDDERPLLVQQSHRDILSDVLRSDEAAEQSLLYSYKYGFSGFAALLSRSEARLIADYPGVVRVIPNRIFRPQTTRSWDFLHVSPHHTDGILAKGHSGRGSIIGIMDTGIWPESESFRDKGMDKAPSRWKGICQEGEKFNASNCNKKIIGARWYLKGYEAEFGKLNKSQVVEFLSPRDAVGHGTHTSSTAAGMWVQNANFGGLARGSARGGAPSAWLAIYKVCWATGGCSSADLLKAMDDAISDGVDVLSVSLGSSPPIETYVDDTLAIGSFHAVAAGISVVCSAGNSGPYAQTVTNTAPWIITVAASTIDRAFPTAITLGNNQTLMGRALYTGKKDDKYYPVVFGQSILSAHSDEDSASSCDSGSLNSTLAKGKVILCFQSRTQRLATVAAQTVTSAHGAGVIFAQFPSKDITTSTSIPFIHVDYTLGTYLLMYMESDRNPVVKFSATRSVVGRQIAPEVAVFSSRGPSSLSPSVLKPDIAAPGVSILASWSPAASDSEMSPGFNIESGTSMSCPHVSGIVALLRTIHPKWSPAKIQSALVTTASIRDEYKQSVVAEGAPHKQADAFDYGGGHVDPNRAMDPGLVFDADISNYICFLCSLEYNNSAISNMTRIPTDCSKARRDCLLNLNLPSIVIPNLQRCTTVSRTVTNVGAGNSIYIARIEAPAGIIVKVKPSTLLFSSTVYKQTFNVIFRSHIALEGRYTFGYLYWEDGRHVVRIPLVVRTVIDNYSPET
ncbi:hypothetical protein MLD38_013872 [Melastoma candidum]|uniref:Uncharacterized protein n=1 Tax=Melastoma candidum TaxID=119954 RepID=A0ACB9RAZ5_9MYRT|nr:hypothetical protein MLD38_013872 [Melastoma candidum]